MICAVGVSSHEIGEVAQAAPRAFSPNFSITQCDAVCELAGIRPHATVTCTQVADGPGLH